MKNSSILRLSISGLLIAVGIIIPTFSPVKFIFEPASFTLASHAAIFIAMFISPAAAVAVAAGTTIGFFFGGFPLIIVLRAASHLIFALAGSLYIKRAAGRLSGLRLRMFSLSVGMIHGVCELIVVSLFYRAGGVGEAYYNKGFVLSVLLLVGLGTVIHSMVDFEIAVFIKRILKKQKSLSDLFIC